MTDPNAQPQSSVNPSLEGAPTFEQMTEVLGNLDVIRHTDPSTEMERQILAVTEASRPGAAQEVIDSLKAAKERLADTRPMAEKVLDRKTEGAKVNFTDSRASFDPVAMFLDTQDMPSKPLVHEDTKSEVEIDHKPNRFISVLNRLADKLPPLVPDYVGQETMPVLPLTDEERAVLDYENTVAGTLRILMRAAGVEETPTPIAAGINIRLDTIDLQARAAQQNAELKAPIQTEGEK